MKKVTYLDVAIWVLAVAPILLVTVLYARLPERVPMHWDLNGTVDYQSKVQLWMIAGLSPVLAILFRVLPFLDPKKRNYEKFWKSYCVFQFILMLFLFFMVGMVLMESLHPGTVDVGVGVTLLLAVLFIVLGNMMPKFRRNFYCGLKNPWTLSSDTVWTRTHRLGGRLLFTAGVLSVPTIFLTGSMRFPLLMALIFAAIIIPNVMSYIWFKREEKLR